MSFLTNKTFWVDTIERAIKTFAQGAAAMLAANATGLLDAAWAVVLSVAGLAALISVLTSIASGGGGNSASLVVETKELR